jgi:hypothetical protein
VSLRGLLAYLGAPGARRGVRSAESGRGVPRPPPTTHRGWAGGWCKCKHPGASTGARRPAARRSAVGISRQAARAVGSPCPCWGLGAGAGAGAGGWGWGCGWCGLGVSNRRPSKVCLAPGVLRGSRICEAMDEPRAPCAVRVSDARVRKQGRLALNAAERAGAARCRCYLRRVRLCWLAPCCFACWAQPPCLQLLAPRISRITPTT